ncbi:fluoride efflux transporter CrcB, partial [Micromonospora aurantiaca]|nr:fluoride efflux transporter CrcB [Micromonospora aurantiaca]
FSAYAVDAQRLLTDGAAGTAGVYLAATVLGALAAVAAGDTVTARLLAARDGSRR